MTCNIIRQALLDFGKCEITIEGARIATHCLYPSFETVYVYVLKFGDEYRVHDGGGAYRSAWTHGRDENLIRRDIAREIAQFHLQIADEAIISPDVSVDWLENVIIGVANASSLAAHRAVARQAQAAEEALIERIDQTLGLTFERDRIVRDIRVSGKSGGERHFDFVVRKGDDFGLFINGVSPHHASINAKYVAFADVEGDASTKFAVCAQILDADDTALLQQVARIVPLASLAAGATRALR